MIKTSTKVLAVTAAAVMSMASMVANAAGEMKPFILGSTGTGAVADKAADVKNSLTSNGFEVVGEYSPYETAHIIIVTNDTLKKAAASHDRGGYAAGQRVSITKVGDQLQVAYTNPAYMAAAYHVKGDVSSVTNSLKTALGAVKEYGPDEGLTADDLEAVAAVEKGLAAKAGGASKVYRIDIPGKKQTLFGVAMSDEKTGNKYMDDKFIMSEIDFKEVRSTAHLPYDILVTGDEVEALHARFRIAINFPDLSMMGSNSFMNIMPSPDAIKESLTKAAGGTIEEEF